MVTNVLNNAVKYSPPGAPVHFRAVRKDGVLRFEVEDHGIGIPSSERGRMRSASGTPACAGCDAVKRSFIDSMEASVPRRRAMDLPARIMGRRVAYCTFADACRRKSNEKSTLQVRSAESRQASQGERRPGAMTHPAAPGPHGHLMITYCWAPPSGCDKTAGDMEILFASLRSETSS